MILRVENQHLPLKNKRWNLFLEFCLVFKNKKGSQSPNTSGLHVSTGRLFIVIFFEESIPCNITNSVKCSQ